jgi:ATP-dependent protease Clp ATPase subunit
MAGPQVNICDECVAVCIMIIKEDTAGEPRPAGVEESVSRKPL